MITKMVNLYTFDELSEDAKEKAREWWREGALNHEWWDAIYEDAERAGVKLTSFDLNPIQAKGKWIEDACHAAEAILKDHDDLCGTYKLADTFTAERAVIVNEAERDEDGELKDERELDSKLDEIEGEFLRDLCHEYAVILSKEEEYLLSNESVDESIRANEYTFTEEGKREE